MTIIFRLSGEYIGFLSGGSFFDGTGTYIGWCEKDGTVWDCQGYCVGTLVDDSYVLRRLNAPPPVRRTPPVPPVPAGPPNRPASRPPRVPTAGWVDGLAAIGLLPTESDLYGAWEVDRGVLELAEDGTFRWLSGADAADSGTWLYQGNLILRPSESKERGTKRRNVVYTVVAYTHQEVTLRTVRPGENSLPVTLRRQSAPVGDDID